MVNKRVTIWGVGIFEPYPDGGDFILYYRWEIKDMNNTITFSSEKYEDEITYNRSDLDNDLHIIKHRFISWKKGIVLEPGMKFNFVQGLSNRKCFYTEQGAEYQKVPNEDMDLFKLENSPDSRNSTDVSRGIIPGFLYSLI